MPYSDLDLEGATIDAPPDTDSGYPALQLPDPFRGYPPDPERVYNKGMKDLPGMAVRTPRVILGRTVDDVPGLVKPGTIDLTDPFLSTRDAFHIEDGGMRVVLPGMFGKEMALKQYQETGANLGKFKDEKSADDYTQHLATWQDLSNPQPYGLSVIGKTAAELEPPKAKDRAEAIAEAMTGKFKGTLEAENATQKEVKNPKFQVGMVEPANIDLDNLTPLVAQNTDEALVDTLNPISLTHAYDKKDPLYGKTVVIPTIIDGKQFSQSAAIRDYKKTGNHLGVFGSELAATEYTRKLQARQDKFYGGAGIQIQYADKGGAGRPGDLAPNNLAPGGGMPFDTQPPQPDVPDVVSNRGLLASTARGIPIPPPSQEESDRLIRAEQLDKIPEIRRAEPTDRIDVPELDQPIDLEGATIEKPDTTPEPGTRQAEATANRKRLIDAIAATEKQGYPVEHGIGKPDEPEGDRGPTKDMENLVGALHKQEIDALRAGDQKKADGIAQARSFWEEKIKTEGMTEEQNIKAEQASAKAPALDLEGATISKPGEGQDIDLEGATLVSKSLTDRVKGYEGWDHGQWDYGQYSTGYGTKAKYPGEQISKEEAESRLQSELTESAQQIDESLNKTGMKLNADQRDALISFNYNLKPQLMPDGKTLKPAGQMLIETSSNPEEIVNRMVQYNKAGGQALPGLVQRRQDEAKWFNGGAPPPGADQAPLRDITSAVPTEPPETTSAFGRMAGIQKPTVPSPQATEFADSLSRENAREIVGMGQALNQLVISPILQGASEVAGKVAPESQIAKLLDKANKDWWDTMVVATEATRKSLESDPKTQGLAGEAGGMVGNLIPQLLGAAVTPGNIAVKFILPAVTQGMDLLNQAREKGLPPWQQIAAFAWGFAESEAFVNLPLHVQSAAIKPVMRFLERTFKGTLIAGGAQEGLRDINNIISPITGGEQQPFDWKALAKVAIPMGIFGGVMGENAQPRPQGPIAEQAFPKGGEAPPPMPGGDVRFAPKEAPATPAAKPASIVGKKVGTIAQRKIREEPRVYVKRRIAEGATREQAAAEIKADNEQFYGSIDAALPVGSVIRNEGGLYQKEHDGIWRPIGEGAERGKGVKRSAEEGDEIVRVGDGETHDSLDWKPAEPKPAPEAPAPTPPKAPTGDERFAPWAPREQPPPIPAEPEPAGVGLVASPQTTQALTEISETAPTLLKQLQSLPKVTDWIRAVKERAARKQVSAQEIMKMRRETDAIWNQLRDANGKRLSPYQIKIRAHGVTNWINAAGDRAELLRRAALSKPGELRKGYEAAANLTPKEVEIARKINQTYQDYLHRLRAVGIEVTEHANYVNGMWQAKVAAEAGVPMPRKMSDYFRFRAQKVFEDYFTGEQQGYIPYTKDIRELLAFYMQTADKAISDRLMAKDLQKGKASDGTPLTQSSGRISVLPRDIEKLKTKALDNLNKWREGKLRRFGEKNLDRYGTASMKVEDKSKAIQAHASDILDEKLSILREQRATDLEESGEKTLAEYGAKIDKAVDQKEKNRIGAEGTKVGRERSKAIHDYYDAAETAAQHEHDLQVKNADRLAAQGEDFLRKHAAAQSKTFQDLVEETYKKRQKQIARMKGNSFLIDSAFVPKGEQGQRYVIMNYPALQNWKRMAWAKGGDPIYTKVDLAVHPEIAGHLDNLYGQSWFHKKWNEPTDNVFGQYFRGLTKFVFNDFQQYFKQTLFGGGPLAPFHQVHQSYQFSTGHRLDPRPKMIGGNLETIDLENNPRQMQWARDGLMLAPDRVGQHYFMEGMGGGEKNLTTILLRKIGEIDGMGTAGKAADQIDRYADWLFTQYIPSLSLKAADGAYARNLVRFAKELEAGTVTDEQVREHTALQVNATAGLMNKDMQKWGSDPTFQHLMSMVAIAPHFGEGRVRHFGQAAYSLVKYNKGAEQLEGLAIGALALWVAARVINYTGDQDFHFDHPFEAHIGNRWYTMRSIPGDLLRAAPQPLTEAMGLGDQGPGLANFLLNRVAPIPRLLGNLAYGINWRGDKTGDWTIIMDMLYGMMPMSLQGLTKPLTSAGRSDPLSFLDHVINATGFPVHQFSPITEMNRKAHAWIRDYHPEKEQKGTFAPSPYKPLQNALEDMDKDRVLEEIQALKTEQKMDMAAIRKGFAERMDKAFTYSHAGDKFFRTSLSEADKKKFDAAVKYKAEILKKFFLWAPAK